jgi:transcriptional regulator of acetoin/glycerol metabolism
MSNLLRTLISLADDNSVIDTDSLPHDISMSTPSAAGSTLHDVTDAALRKAIEQHHGNVTAAARQLGLHRSTLYRRLFGTTPAPRREVR